MLVSLPRLNGEVLFALADRVARGSGDRGLSLFVQLLSGILERVVRGTFGTAPGVPGEAQLVGRMRAAAPLEAWVGAWENLRAAALRAEELNLDKKQLVLNAFFDLEALTQRHA